MGTSALGQPAKTSADLLPTVLERRGERVVVGQTAGLGELLDDEVVFGDGHGLVDEDGHKRIVVHSAARGLLVLERERLDAVHEIAHVLAIDSQLADAHKEQARRRGVARHGRTRKGKDLDHGTAADALDDGLRGTSVHVVGALDEMKLVRARCARRIRVERGEIRVCIALRHNLLGGDGPKAVLCNLHLCVWRHAGDVVSGLLDRRHVLEVLGVYDVFSLLACTRKLPAIEAVRFETLLEACVRLEHSVHEPPTRHHGKVGNASATHICAKHLWPAREVHPRDHGSARVRHDKLDLVAQLMMEVAHDRRQVGHIVVEAAQRPVAVRVAVAAKIEAQRVDGQRIGERTMVALVLVRQQAVQDERDGAALRRGGRLDVLALQDADDLDAWLHRRDQQVLLSSWHCCDCADVWSHLEPKDVVDTETVAVRFACTTLNLTFASGPLRQSKRAASTGESRILWESVGAGLTQSTFFFARQGWIHPSRPPPHP
ncbi:hypothetical protein L1887_61702 [Cichorium endivia]|nr:hypothetical protein L1887_61702 [Cichorium endivia]